MKYLQFNLPTTYYYLSYLSHTTEATYLLPTT
jgi:hypothetical protein